MAAADVFIATTRSLSYTEARERATASGTRGATMPAVTAEMLARMMRLDFSRMGTRSRVIAARLTRGAEAHLTCPRGSDLHITLTGREGIADDGALHTPGAWGNLPCGEAFISPTTGSGVLVVASIAGIGLREPPARLLVDDGRLAGGDEDLTRLLDAHGPRGRNLAELGVGTNDRAELTGNVLEDEKLLGTVHVAFGASEGIGGTVAVPVHLDCVVLDASLQIDGFPILDAGKLVAEP
jgi:leucyl aminopeptidase (aminopeptidase T)